MSADDDKQLVAEAVGGYFSEMDQNRCVGMAEHEANQREHDEVMAALDRLTAPRVSAADHTDARTALAQDDGEFLRWVAGWLDRIDPILQAVYSNPSTSSAYTDDERQRIIAWLDGTEVQERLRTLAARLVAVERARDEALEMADGMARAPYGEFSKAVEGRKDALARLVAAEDALGEALDEAVSRWHGSETASPLHAWLGLTWAQYSQFAEKGTAGYIAALAVADTGEDA